MPSKLTRAALLLTCFFLSSTCEAQVNPAVKTHAYEMDVIGGIPGGPPGVGAPARQTRHVIFLETAPSAHFSVEGVWMNGKFHSVETATKQPPVRFDSPVKLAQDDKNVAVPATTNTVTEIVVKDPAQDKTPDAATARMLGEHQAVVQLNYQGKPVLVPIKKFEKRDPIYMK